MNATILPRYGRAPMPSTADGATQASKEHRDTQCASFAALLARAVSEPGTISLLVKALASAGWLRYRRSRIETRSSIHSEGILKGGKP